MNKRVILIALTAVMLSTVSYAQKVIQEGNAVIIDCSEMGSKFYHPDKKAQTTSAGDFTSGPNDLTVISSRKSNEKVYKKFEVSKEDNSPVGTTWIEAIEFCEKLTYNGSSDWRLPTQRELMLMWILKEKLYANGVSRFVGYENWSATEGEGEINMKFAWSLYVIKGIMDTADKVYSKGKVRCIRDI